MNQLLEYGLAAVPGPESEAKPPPQACLLSELVRPKSGHDPNELLLHRYLCRGAGLLLVGPTGIGKSSFGMQAMILWSIGEPLFGIKPAKPLKSLLIQAENDDGDLAEMRDGVMAGLNLSAVEKQMAMESIIVAREDARTGYPFFAAVVRPLLEKYRPDLLWIDPALAYLGGEVSSQKDVGGFLRNMLNPLLREFDCGVVVVHHTNKPPVGMEKKEWTAGEFAYLGSGSAEWANWARAVLGLRGIGSHSVFELRAGKRGARLGWKENDDKTPAYAKYIAHAKESGVICWYEAEESEKPAAPNAERVPTKEDVMPHVPVDKPIPKDTLRIKANEAGIAWNKINPLIDELIDESRLHKWEKKRPRTNPQILLSRTPQPPESPPELLK